MQAVAPEAVEPAALKRKSKDDDRQPRAFVSKGEKIHNEITYRGVDWLFNSAFGVAFAFLTARTAWGRENLMAPLNKFWIKALAPAFVNGEAKQQITNEVLGVIKHDPASAAHALQAISNGLHQSAEWGTRITTILFGGTITIAPMVMLEEKNNKKSLIKSLDTMIYGKQAVENDPKFQQSYDEIGTQPKKSFGAGMAGRLLALVPIFAITLTPKLHNPVKRYYYDSIEWLSAKGAKAVGLQPKSLMEHISTHGSGDGKPISDWKFIQETIGFDFGTTLAYSFIHEHTYKFAARFFDTKQKEKQAKNDTSVAAIPATEPQAKVEERPIKQTLPEPAAPTAIIQQTEHHATLQGGLAHAL